MGEKQWVLPGVDSVATKCIALSVRYASKPVIIKNLAEESNTTWGSPFYAVILRVGKWGL
jgi:hypothetical protein